MRAYNNVKMKPPASEQQRLHPRTHATTEFVAVAGSTSGANFGGVMLHGCYLETQYFLTGARRQYNHFAFFNRVVSCRMHS